MKRLLSVSPRELINFCIVSYGAGGERVQLRLWSTLASPKFVMLSKLVHVLCQWQVEHPGGGHQDLPMQRK